MSITPVGLTDAISPSATSASSSDPVVRSLSTAYASTAASLSQDAGVIATLAGAAPLTGNSAVDLYNSVANASRQANVTTSGSSAPGSDAAAAVNSALSALSLSNLSSPTSNALNATYNVGSEWSSIVSSNPNLSLQAVQASQDQALVNTLA